MSTPTPEPAAKAESLRDPWIDRSVREAATIAANALGDILVAQACGELSYRTSSGSGYEAMLAVESALRVLRPALDAEPVGEPPAKSEGERVEFRMDGNKWCATLSDFVNLQESPAGFGDTQLEAVRDLLAALSPSQPAPEPTGGEALSLLRELEWSATATARQIKACPCCYGWHPDASRHNSMTDPSRCGHKDDCKLAALLSSPAAPSAPEKGEDLLAAIWLYIDWRYVTKQLTTEQKEMFADAIDSHFARDEDNDGFRVERWWRDASLAPQSPAAPKEPSNG